MNLPQRIESDSSSRLNLAGLKAPSPYPAMAGAFQSSSARVPPSGFSSGGTEASSVGHSRESSARFAMSTGNLQAGSATIAGTMPAMSSFQSMTRSRLSSGSDLAQGQGSLRSGFISSPVLTPRIVFGSTSALDPLNSSINSMSSSMATAATPASPRPYRLSEGGSAVSPRSPVWRQPVQRMTSAPCRATVPPSSKAMSQARPDELLGRSYDPVWGQWQGNGIVLENIAETMPWSRMDSARIAGQTSMRSLEVQPTGKLGATRTILSQSAAARSAVDYAAERTYTTQRVVTLRSVADKIAAEKAAAEKAAQKAMDARTAVKREIVQKITADQAAAELRGALAKGTERVVWTPEKSPRQNASGVSQAKAAEDQQALTQRMLAARTSLARARDMLLRASEQLGRKDLTTADQAEILQLRAIAELGAAEIDLAAVEKVAAKKPAGKRTDGCLRGCIGTCFGHSLLN